MANIETRRKHAKELLNQFENDWGGNDTLKELSRQKYAIVTQRDSDAWVNGVTTKSEIASAIASAVSTDGLEVEWIEGIYDLDTGKPADVKWDVKILVTVNDSSFEYLGG